MTKNLIKIKVYNRNIELLIAFFFLSIIFFLGCSNNENIRLSALHYFQEGNSAYHQRDYQAAVWNYSQAIKLDSKSPEMFYNLGLAYYETGNYKNAIKSFKQVEDLTPGLAGTYYNIALAYNKIYKSELAHRYYNKYQAILNAENDIQTKKEDRQINQLKQQINDLKNSAEKSTNKSPQQKKATIMKTTSQYKKTNQNNIKSKNKIPSWDN